MVRPRAVEATHGRRGVIRSHSFRGVRRRVLVDDVVQGYVDRGELYIASNLTPRRSLEVAVHEALHAEEPGLTEAQVDRISKSLGRFLWRLGYRLGGNDGRER